MYIISKNKDYYDGVVGTMGIDKTIVYERNVIEIEEKTEFPEPFKYKRKYFNYSENESNFVGIDSFGTIKESKYVRCSSFIVGFCGKLYLGWRMYYEDKEFNSIINQMDNILKYDIIYGYENVEKELTDSRWGGNLYDMVQYVLNYDPINIFREINSPIFIFDNGIDIRHTKHSSQIKNIKTKFIINPVLKDYEFYKVIDAFTAFQEIQMFIAGVLGIGEKEIIEVEDKYKIPQHGFDKWSFRKEPTKKK